jgi:hypothetical protein
MKLIKASGDFAEVVARIFIGLLLLPDAKKLLVVRDNFLALKEPSDPSLERQAGFRAICQLCPVNGPTKPLPNLAAHP